MHFFNFCLKNLKKNKLDENKHFCIIPFTYIDHVVKVKFEFSAVIRGFDVYRYHWYLKKAKYWIVFHERNNLFDIFAIKVFEKENNRTVWDTFQRKYQELQCSFSIEGQLYLPR